MSARELEELFTIDELARLAKVARRTIERHIAQKRISIVKVGSATRITSSEARRYLSGGNVYNPDNTDPTP